jgi:hypothetical protein
MDTETRTCLGSLANELKSTLDPDPDYQLSPTVNEWKTGIEQERDEWDMVQVPLTVPPFLARINKHPRDMHITLEAKSHRYAVTWEPRSAGPYSRPCSDGLISTTTLVGSHFVGFNAQTTIGRMMASPRWRSSDYFGMTPTAIQHWWRYNGEIARWCGQQMHTCIEHFYNNNDQVNVHHLPEMQLFQRFVSDYQLEPFRTEMRVFSSSWYCVTGSIDMVFVSHCEPWLPPQCNSQSSTPPTTDTLAKYTLHLLLYDWKRVKKLNMGRTDGKKGTKARGVFRSFEDCNWIKYSAQLYTYKYLLEHFYQNFEWRGRLIDHIVVDELYLLVLHPSQANYQRVAACDLTEAVDQMMATRRRDVIRNQPHLVDMDPLSK